MNKTIWPKDEEESEGLGESEENTQTSDEGLNKSTNSKKEVSDYSELVNELEKESRSMIKREFDTTKAVVREVLKQKEKARNSDKYLIWFIKHKVEGHDLNEFEEYKDSTNPETIRRVRQDIQNSEGEFLPTSEEVLERRGFREDEIREYFSSSRAEEILS